MYERPVKAGGNEEEDEDEAVWGTKMVGERSDGV